MGVTTASVTIFRGSAGRFRFRTTCEGKGNCGWCLRCEGAATRSGQSRGGERWDQSTRSAVAFVPNQPVRASVRFRKKPGANAPRLIAAGKFSSAARPNSRNRASRFVALRIANSQEGAAGAKATSLASVLAGDAGWAVGDSLKQAAEVAG